MKHYKIIDKLSLLDNEICSLEDLVGTLRGEVLAENPENKMSEKPRSTLEEFLEDGSNIVEEKANRINIIKNNLGKILIDFQKN